MKYTIELTDKQRKRFKHMNKALIKMGMGFDILSLLEPIKTINVKDTKEYQIGYKEGYEDCKDGVKQVEYTKGYNNAINDYNMMIQWLHDCTDDFKEFMNKKYGYDVMYLTNPKVDEGVMLYDLMCDHDIAEVISEFQKWLEEKKKSDEIKVGDEVYLIDKNHPIVVTSVVGDTIVCLAESGKYSVIDTSTQRKHLTKTGRHFDELEQLLDKLRGKK